MTYAELKLAADRLAGPAPAPAPLMSLRGIGKAFGSQVALRGVDLDLFGGECLGLVGDNGAGKSTLSKIMSGAYLPDSGRILLSGAEVRLAGPAEARTQRIEMV